MNPQQIYRSGKSLFLILLMAALAACGGGGDTGSTSDGSSAGSGSAGATNPGGSSSTGGTADVGSGSGNAGSGGSSSAGGGNANAGIAEAGAIGYGAATTGAGSSPLNLVSVASLAEAQAAIDSYQKAGGTNGLKITYTGAFNFASITDPCTQFKLSAQTLEIKGESNKPLRNISIIGADGSAANFGIHIVGSASNIIIRNMTIGLTPGGGDSDIVGVEGSSAGVPSNIWIDHNTFFTSLAECSGAGDTEFDGMLDFKKGATNVTVSYNYLHDHHKVSLNGYSDSDTAERLITFHHNVFENLGSRTPLQRAGYSHLFNNLFSSILTSGINVRMGGYSLIEGNYFENAKNPVTSRDSSELGYWELLNNNISGPGDFKTYGITWTSSDASPSKNADDWTTTKTFPREKLGYAYTAQSPACVKRGLRAVAGAGTGMATLNCN